MPRGYVPNIFPTNGSGKGGYRLCYSATFTKSNYTACSCMTFWMCLLVIRPHQQTLEEISWNEMKYINFFYDLHSVLTQIIIFIVRCCWERKGGGEREGRRRRWRRERYVIWYLTLRTSVNHIWILNSRREQNVNVEHFRCNIIIFFCQFEKRNIRDDNKKKQRALIVEWKTVFFLS